MKATILLGTLKTTGLSSTETLCEFLTQRMEREAISVETIKLVNRSSLIQRAIERLDALHDRIMAGEPSPLQGKTGGIVITGDSDGAQRIIANVCNFFNAIGVVVPPYASLSVLWERQAKDKRPTKDELMKNYDADYGKAADTMVRQLKTSAAPTSYSSSRSSGRSRLAPSLQTHGCPSRYRAARASA